MYKVDDVIAGEYAVSRVFTNGGMGVVYKVHRTEWDVDMAMKCPRPELFQTEDQRKGFVKECETWMNLGAHPNIVSCYYIKTIDAVPAVLMEYADGGSLLDCIRSGRLYEGSPAVALKRIIDFAIQTSRGLYHAHSKGYVHQDVKPANVLLTRSGIAKVSDFGLSKAKGVLAKATLESDGRSLVVSSGGWTPAYGSPEQACGMTLTRRTDIWSWAAMVLEMIHGKIFWKAGPYVDRELKKLWPWEIFSSKVKSSRGLVDILKECLEVHEERRPKDFDVIESKLIALYERIFSEPYPRHLPPDILMSETALCNRIASYAELARGGGDYFSNVYDCLDTLHKTSPWTIWGDLNYAAYCQPYGMTVQEILCVVENQLRRANTDEEKDWLLNLLLSLGVSSMRDPMVRLLRIDESGALVEKLQTFHESLQDRLSDVFFNGPVKQPEFESPERHDSERKEGVSESGVVRVNVDWHWTADRQRSLTVKVVASGKVYVKEEQCLPSNSYVKRITTDDNGVKISLWLWVYGQGWHQKVLSIQDGKLISYGCDFRKTEHWGTPEDVYVSGDAKIMMLRYQDDVVSVWLNERGDDGDGRNICEVKLQEFSLMPSDSLLPGLVLERSFGYSVSGSVAYRLMRTLAHVYGKRHIPCHISRPESSHLEISRYENCYVLLTHAKQAAADADGDRLASVVPQCISQGVLPSEQIMKAYHDNIIENDAIHLGRCWHAGSINEYWEEPIENLHSFEDGVFQIVSYGRRPRILAAGEVGLCACRYDWTLITEKLAFDLSDPSFVPICSCENQDIVVAICSGWDVISVCRIAKSKSGSQRTIWSYKPISGLKCSVFMHDLRQNNSTIAFQLPNDMIVLLSKTDGSVRMIPAKGFLRYLSVGFSLKSRMALLADCKDGIIARDPLGAAVDTSTISNCITDENRVYGISADGAKLLVCKTFGIWLCDLEGGEGRIICDMNPLHSGSISQYSMSCCALSPNGRVAAVITSDRRLRLYDTQSSLVVFEWRLPPGTYGSPCFDSSSRWFGVVRDRNKVEAFQLFWECNG